MLTDATTCSMLGRELSYRPVPVTTPDRVAIAAQDFKRPGSGRDVLFIHGFAQSHLAWLKQVTSPLADEFRLVTYDNRGHGVSDKPLEPAFYREPERWAGEVDAVISTLGLDRPVLVAWSYAGRIALDYLTAYGDGAISGLVMVGATSTMGPKYAGPAAPLLKEMATPELAPGIEATRAFVRACFSTPLPQDEVEVMLAFSAATPHQVRAAMGGRPTEYAATLASIRVPTLVVHGQEDRVVLPVTGAYTAENVAGARHLTYEGVGHVPFWEASDRFNADLAAFLRELP